MTKSTTTASSALDRKAVVYMFLLALQFGIQPVLTRRYTPKGITRSTVILTQEVVKFGIALVMLRFSGATSEAFRGRLRVCTRVECHPHYAQTHLLFSLVRLDDN
jgi:hypothetical protein